MKELKVLIDKEQLEKRIKEVADKINASYLENEQLYVICVLKGAVVFFSSLFTKLKMPAFMECVQLSSYGSSQESSGEISVVSMNLPDLQGKNVLIVEDILDTGLTLSRFKKDIKEKFNAKDVKIAVLLNKQSRRKYDIQADFTCFEIEDKFVVGYGLDVDEALRNLPYIGYYE